MPALIEANTPSYISSQSADVILSDVRPFRLKGEALHAINALLDEFLYSILDNAGSLSTDKLRASLLSLLPTSLGKEALLEAEVELRAYWDRTTPEGGSLPVTEDDSKTFHLQWSYELLRLKCEAYSTLNESDEDPTVEDRIQARFIQTASIPPSAALLAPAALYLTAILEAMCEHVLTNVGRVAARDSSRVSATVNDLFTALCEDDSIYGLFRSMRVYEQIELLSKSPVKSRRSKSFSRSDLGGGTNTHAGSPHQDLSLGKDSVSISRSRLSSEVSSTTTSAMPGVTTPSSRTSVERARAARMFAANSKGSIDGDSQSGHHKKSESGISEKQHLQEDSQRTLYEDSVLQQEFDDLMRSSSTMKVSLTPDRLKTMEVYKQEKDMRASRRPVPLSYKADSDSISSKRPSLRHVDSIVEDEEETPLPPPPLKDSPRVRQSSVAPPPTASIARPPSARTRSISASSIGHHVKASRNNSRQQPSSLTTQALTNSTSSNNSEPNMTRPTKLSEQPNGFPPRTRKRQQNRESLDLDDVMAGSDDDALPAPPTPSHTSRSSKRSTPGGVSAATRELMDFLEQGPPNEPGSRSGGGLTDFLNDGPASFDAKPKGDRLRRMISKLSLSGGEKSKNGTPYVPSKTHVTKHQPLPVAVLPTPPRPHHLSSQSSLTGLSSLANRPVPPRIPRPPSPPSSHEDISPPPTPVKATNSIVKANNSIVPYSPTQSTRSSNRPSSPTLVPPRKDSRDRTPSHQTNVNGSTHSSHNGSANGSVNGHVTGQTKYAADTSASKPVIVEPAYGAGNDLSPPPLQKRKVHPTVITAGDSSPSDPTVGLSPGEVRHLHRLISRATTADECRLILDMFITKFRLPPESQDASVSYPSPSTSVAGHGQSISPEDSELEQSIVELFLGGEGSLEGMPRVPNEAPSSGVNFQTPTPIIVPPPHSDGTLVNETEA